MIQQSPELSLQYFNEAKKLRHQGDFTGAIKMLKNSILVYQDDPELPTNFYSLGKTYYLADNFALSVNCYETYSNLCTIFSPQIVSDYRYFKNTMSMTGPAIPFHTSFTNLAHNVGHALEDPKNKSRFYREIACYRSQLLGKHPEEDAAYQKYDENICVETGFKKIYSWMDNFLTSRDMKRYTLNMMNDILNS